MSWRAFVAALRRLVRRCAGGEEAVALTLSTGGEEGDVEELAPYSQAHDVPMLLRRYPHSPRTYCHQAALLACDVRQRSAGECTELASAEQLRHYRDVAVAHYSAIRRSAPAAAVWRRAPRAFYRFIASGRFWHVHVVHWSRCETDAERFMLAVDGWQQWYLTLCLVLRGALQRSAHTADDAEALPRFSAPPQQQQWEEEEGNSTARSNELVRQAHLMHQLRRAPPPPEAMFFPSTPRDPPHGGGGGGGVMETAK